MPRYKLVVLSGPAPGCDDAFNDWYDRQHLKQMLSCHGFRSAQRFALSHVLSCEIPYLVIYEIETDDIDRTIADMAKLSVSPDLVRTDAIDARVCSAIYQELGKPLTQGSTSNSRP